MFKKKKKRRKKKDPLERRKHHFEWTLRMLLGTNTNPKKKEQEKEIFVDHEKIEREKKGDLFKDMRRWESEKEKILMMLNLCVVLSVHKDLFFWNGFGVEV